MRFSLTLVASLCSFAAAAPLLDNRGTGFNYGQDKIRGVNLGGWLVLEPWITPSLWDGFDPNSGGSPVDEYTLMQAWGSSAQSKMKNHWDTWYSQADFQKIADAGLNMVRIPIGYWAWYKAPGDAYVQGQVPYLDKAIGWARSSGLKVWIDLHGAPGSQNGFDNSGRRGGINWQQGNNVKDTLAVLRKISSKYAQSSYADVVIGIELLNEPLGPNLDMDGVKQFHKDGFGQVRDYSKDRAVVMSDAFQTPSYWNGVLSGNNNVAIDHHDYQVFSPGQVKMSSEQHVEAACGARNNIAGSDKWVVVGEWSGAMTDCAKWLNGYGRGARFEGQYDNSPYVGSCADKNDLNKWSSSFKDQTRKYIEAQLNSWETQAGWIFWTWKAESAAEWDMSWLLKEGVFPNPVTSRKYPNICG